MSGSYFFYGSGTWSMSYLVTGGWAYAPMGDVYPLKPLWNESHSVSGDVIHPEDEENRYSMVAAYDSDTDPFFVLSVTEDDPETTEIEDDIPEGVVSFSSRIWVPHGWAEERELGVDLVVTDPPEEAWTGKFRISFPLDVRKEIGWGRSASFVFDFWSDLVTDRVRLAYGDVVFRR